MSHKFFPKTKAAIDAILSGKFYFKSPEDIMAEDNASLRARVAELEKENADKHNKILMLAGDLNAKAAECDRLRGALQKVIAHQPMPDEW